MANVHIQCPTCKAELEIGAEHLGQQVECGSCLQSFTAEEAPTRSSGRSRRPRDDDDDEDDRPRRRRRRRRDDEDDFDYSPSSEGGGSGFAVTSLVLGIIGLVTVCCWYLGLPLSLLALIFGAIGMRNPEGRGMAIAGFILGILTLAIYGVVVLFFANALVFR